MSDLSSNAPRWHLAQINLGLFQAPLDSPEMADFAAGLDRINDLADQAPGFVWRLKDDAGGPSSNVAVPGTDDPLLACNLTVWEDMESLRDFMYRTDHVSYLRRRADWFQHVDEAMVAGWWVPAGTVPTLEEGMERLQSLRDNGPSDYAFALNRPLPAPTEPPTTSAGASAGPERSDTSPARSPQPLIPYLTVGDARAALQFYAEVFGAEPQGEVFEMDDGRIGHAELNVGGQSLYLADDFPEMDLVHPAGHGGPRSVALVIHVDDCDAVYHHALAAGATSERPPSDQHGFRNGWFVDPWGHRWSPTSTR
jgi:uncharacterized glyoxalase superfamily protein PhnB